MCNTTPFQSTHWMSHITNTNNIKNTNNNALYNNLHPLFQKLTRKKKLSAVNIMKNDKNILITTHFYTFIHCI